MGARKAVVCANCHSLERTRVVKLLLDHHKLPVPGSRVLHISPERGLATGFLNAEIEYEPVDIRPDLFDFCDVRKLDLCAGAANLPNEHYDLIVHSHVMEHVPCCVTAVLYHLHRSLKPDGYHVMCIPFMDGHYEEALGPLEPAEAEERFGQHDHVRRFGRDDIAATLGMVFDLPLPYDLHERFSSQQLDEVNIPRGERQNLTGSTVFVLRKGDIRLR